MPAISDDLTKWTLTDLKDAEKKIAAELARRGRRIGSKRYQIVVDAWNRITADCPRLGQVVALGDRRLTHLRARMNEPAFADGYEDIFQAVVSSPFLRGDRTKWKASFDWVICNNANYVKVLEGKYEADGQGDEYAPAPTSKDDVLKEMGF